MTSVLISQLIQLFGILLIGYILFKTHLFTVESNQIMTRFLLDCTVPCQIIGSVMNPESGRDYAGVGAMFLYGTLLYIIFTIIGIILTKLVRYPRKQQGIYIFCHIFSNAGFMGFPVVAAVLGNDALVYAAITTILFNVFAFTIGIILMNYEGSLDGGISSALELIDLKQMVTPGIIGILLSIVIYFIPVHYPDEIKGICVSIGNITSPLAMMLIGSVLARIPIKEVLGDWRVYLFTIIRQILVPLVTWPLLCLICHNEFLRLILFLQFAMPVANTVVLFTTRFQKDEKLAARLVFVTTILSIVTIPLCMLILGL